MNSFDGEVELQIRKSPWSFRLGNPPYRWSKLHAFSKNRLYKLKTSEGEFVVKVFAQTPYGRKSAWTEYQAFQALHGLGLKSLPKCVGHFDNGVVTEYLMHASAVEGPEAYKSLEHFLVQTQGLTVDWAVADDSGCKQGFLSQLRVRLDRLQLDGETRDNLEKIYHYLESDEVQDFTERPKRFVLSDFHPGQVVSSQGKVYFLDLEHAGMGDLRRFLCNLLLHPKGALSRKQLKSIQEILGLRAEDLALVFPFSFMEWTLIVLNFYSKERQHKELDAKAVKRRQELARKHMAQAFDWMKSRQSWFELYMSERNQR